MERERKRQGGRLKERNVEETEKREREREVEMLRLRIQNRHGANFY